MNISRPKKSSVVQLPTVEETGRKIPLLKKDSSSIFFVKWEDEIGRRAASKSAYLHTLWMSGSDPMFYFDAAAAKVERSRRFPIYSIQAHLIKMNLSRQSAHERRQTTTANAMAPVVLAETYSDLDDLEKLLFKSVYDELENSRRADCTIYESRRIAIVDENSWLNSVIVSSLDPAYYQLLRDFHDWRTVSSLNNVYKSKQFLESRAVAINGEVTTAMRRKADLDDVEFGNVQNYEHSIRVYKTRLQSYITTQSEDRRRQFLTNPETIWALKNKLIHESWTGFHRNDRTYDDVYQLLTAIEKENNSISTLQEQLHPKRSLVINTVVNAKKRPKYSDNSKSSNSKPNIKSNYSKPVIDWKSHTVFVKNLPAATNPISEESVPCYWCIQSSFKAVQNAASSHAGKYCYSRYPKKKL